MTEQDLAALGVHRIAVPVPFVAAGGPVNLTVIEAADGSLTLFDAGLGSAEGQAAIEAGFARLGLDFARVTRILVSHGHIDHFGAARFIEERAGHPLRVEAHPADLPKLDEAGPRFRDRAPFMDAHLARHGVPQAVRDAIRIGGEAAYGGARRVTGVVPAGEGTVVEGRDLRFEAIHFPGHTPGLLALHAPAAKLLIASDHLLERISPNPLMELGPQGQEGWFRPLLAYLGSLARTRALDLDLVIPGHGPAFGGHRALIDALLGFFERRQAKLAALLAEGPRSAWALCGELFPRARASDAYLTMSETLANLEVLEDRGAITRVADGAGVVFRTTSEAADRPPSGERSGTP